MGSQFGPLSIRGKFGGLQFGRNSDGSWGVKRAARYSKRAYKTSARYARTRDNAAEFTGGARAAKSLRLAMGDRMREFSDSQLQSRLQQLMVQAIQRGPGMGGQRTLEVVPNLDLFRRVDLDPRERLQNRFLGRYTLTVNADRNTVTMDVPAFNTDLCLRAPSGTTHFRLLLVAGVLSDFHYTGSKAKYEPVNPMLNGESALVESPILDAVGVVNPTMQLVTSLAGNPVLPTTAGLMVSLGIEFFKEVNGVHNLLASGNAMQVVDAY
jgi:hypothetical protein